MKKNVWKGAGIGLSIVLLSIIVMYLSLVHYYGEGFSYGTFINGVYCTGKSIQEVNAELSEKWSYEGLTITDGDGKSYTILPEEVQLSYDYEKALEGYLDRQNPYLWVDNLLEDAKKRELEPDVSYDRQRLEELISALPIFENTVQGEPRLCIEKGEEGYYLVNERVHVLDEEKARNLIKTAFDSYQTSLNLETEGCYRDLPLTQKMEEDLKLWDKLSEYQNCGIVYEFGDEKVPIDAGVVCDFLSLDEQGEPLLDEEGCLCTDEDKVYAFVDALADEYDTVGSVRQFQATRGEIVTVEGGIYGNKIDRKAEKEYLLTAFLEKKREVHVPFYTQLAKKQGKDDIGDTYIEVDMTDQMLYYYVEGKLEIETPVVTGNMALRRSTPEGTNYVYNKQKNRILRGEGYASPVDFWIPVKGAIGIHDSSWRSKYGGEIYKTNGSHGCINTPYEAVSKLYDMVEIGTPCVMFY